MQAQARAAEEKRQKELQELKNGYGEQHTLWKKAIEDAQAERRTSEARYLEEKKLREEERREQRLAAQQKQSDHAAFEKLIQQGNTDRQAAEARFYEEKKLNDLRIAQLQNELNRRSGCIIA